MRVFDPFGLIGSTISYASSHDYAPLTLLAVGLVVVLHLLVLLAVVGTAVRTVRRYRDRRAVVAIFTPTGTLSTIPQQRATSPHDQVI